MFVIDIETWHELVGPFKRKDTAEGVLRKKGFRPLRLETWMREGEKVGEEEFAQIREVFSPKEHNHI